MTVMTETALRVRYCDLRLRANQRPRLSPLEPTSHMPHAYHTARAQQSLQPPPDDVVPAAHLLAARGAERVLRKEWRDGSERRWL